MVLWALRWGLSREEAGGQEWVVLAGGKAAVALRRVRAQEHRARLRQTAPFSSGGLWKGTGQLDSLLRGQEGSVRGSRAPV